MTAVAHYWHKFQQYDRECTSFEDAVTLLGTMYDAGDCAPIGIVVDDGSMQLWDDGIGEKWIQS